MTGRIKVVKIEVVPVFWIVDQAGRLIQTAEDLGEVLRKGRHLAIDKGARMDIFQYLGSIEPVKKKTQSSELEGQEK